MEERDKLASLSLETNFLYPSFFIPIFFTSSIKTMNGLQE